MLIDQYSICIKELLIKTADQDPIKINFRAINNQRILSRSLAHQ